MNNNKQSGTGLMKQIRFNRLVRSNLALDGNLPQTRKVDVEP